MPPTDPSQTVAPGLLLHVHLISQHSYPWQLQQHHIDTIVQHLREAPRIVRTIQPVAWQYLQPPQDGSVFLKWQPLNTQQTTHATDGYIWGDVERQFQQRSNEGYGVEIFLTDSGFKPGEQVATHRRIRYRLVSSPNGEPVDPSLEIVHYTKSPNEKHIPVQAIQIDQQKQTLLKQRQYLEEQGALVKKNFMLHDQNNWPSISMPTRPVPMMPNNPYAQMPGMPHVNPAQPMGRPGGPPQPFYGQQPGLRPGPAGQPPAKRIRGPPPPRAGVPGPVMNMNPTELVDEENAAAGDELDFLSPREISVTRYKQHHEWMEEILLSPYAVHRILPVDLRLKLSGDLSEITNGLFKSDDDPQEPHKIKEEQIEELQKRIEEFQSKGQAEIARMKSEHAKKMEETAQHKGFAGLEQRLSKTSPETTDGETVESVISDFERATGQKFATKEDVVRVQRGGLLHNSELAAMGPKPSAMQADEFGDFINQEDNLDSAGEALDSYFEENFNPSAFVT